MPVRTEHEGSIAATLEQIRKIAGLEGAAIVDLGEAEVSASAGSAGVDTIAFGRGLLADRPDEPSHGLAGDYRQVLACPWFLPPARPGGLLLWRDPHGRAWSSDDYGLAASLAVLIVASFSADAGQIGMDKLTGLPNRRWFIDEADRRIERLDRGEALGTLSLIDIDDLSHLNDTLGRETGDRVLVRLAGRLRSIVRPTDLVARVGADEFALWQDGMDHMTAAERADALCARPLFGKKPDVKLSIGIATRSSGCEEDVRTLLRRAHMAARDVKAEGGGSWRVSRAETARRLTNRTG